MPNECIVKDIEFEEIKERLNIYLLFFIILKYHIISDEHGIKGNNILPNPPINIGIIIEDIINIPWKVILALYWRDEHGINPGKANSNRNIIDNPKPIERAKILIIKG